MWGIFSIGEVKSTFLEKRVAKFKQRTLEEKRSKTTIADHEQVLIFLPNRILQLNKSFNQLLLDFIS